LRVLTLTNLYPNPFQPTRAPFNRQQLAILARKHEVRVIAPIAWMDEFQARRRGNAALPSGRRIVSDGLIVDHPRYFYLPKLGRQWYGRCYQASVARTFDQVLEEFAPDVVFAPWAYPDGWAAVQLSKRHRLPVVVKCHGSDVLMLDQHPARQKPTVEAVRSADAVVAVSRHLAGRLLEMGVDADRVQVIIDGVDREKFSPGSKSRARERLGITTEHPIVLFVGNLVPVKGVDVLLSSCEELFRTGVPHQLIVIGDGPLRSKLERQATALGIRESVHFQGVVKHDQLPDWFRASDLFVLPSRSEGVPSVLLEASACETPWVGSNVGGIPEIAEFGRSQLTPPGSATELARAIREMLAVSKPGSTKSPRSCEEAVDDLSAVLQAALGRRTRAVAEALA
jgi:glycosyltransferase involved in cell wall biosynthesis